MYATNSPGQIEYIINDAKIRTLFVGEQLQYNNAFKVQKDSKYLERLVVFDPAVKMNPEDKTSIYFDDFLRLGDNAHAESTVKIRMTEAVPEDLATIIYTSGTTGESKGVMLPHSCYLEAMRIHDVRLPLVTDKDLSMSFLPMTHIFEKAWCYYCLHKRGYDRYQPRPENDPEDIAGGSSYLDVQCASFLGRRCMRACMRRSTPPSPANEEEFSWMRSRLGEGIISEYKN